MSGSVELESIEHQLRARERLWGVKVVAMMLAGAPLCLLGPVLLASMFWAAALFGLGRQVSWLWLCGGLTVICVPLLIHLELRTRGAYLMEGMQDGASGLEGYAFLPGPAAQVIAMAAALSNPRSVSAGFVELFLQGPRLLVGAVRQLRVRRRLSGVDRRHAAEIVGTLLARTQGVELKSLAGHTGPADDTWPTLSWLIFFGWVGVSADAVRVYLYSAARERLQPSV